jgi:hypothetical protein
MKTRSGKKVRLLTGATGTAACAIAFGPTAMATAGTGQTATAAPGHQATKEPDHQGGIRPDGVHYSCPAGTKNWLHMVIASGKVICVGDKGYYTLSRTPAITSLCGGNNYGSIFGVTTSQVGVIFPFDPGDRYGPISPHVTVSAVSIYNWKGTDKCGYP